MKTGDDARGWTRRGKTYLPEDGRQHRAGRRKASVAVASSIIVALALAGCSSGDSGSAAAPEVSVAEQDGRSGDAAGKTGDSASGQSQGSQQEGKTSTNPGPSRHVIHSASLSIEVKDLADAVDRVRAFVAESDGYLAEESSTESRARLELKVPADRFSKDLDWLAGLGRVQQRSQEAEDVTEEMVDTQSRIESQAASIQRLRALLREATDIGEIVEIEGELTERESELDSVKRQHASLSDQVELAAVTVTLRSDSAPPPEDDDGGGFLAGLFAGWQALVAVGGVTLRVLGAVLPFAVAIGVPVGALLWLWRRRARVLKKD